jgi:cytochrome c553
MRAITVAGLVFIGFIGLNLAYEASFAGEQNMTHRKKTQIERGRYLVSLGGCNDCHSPKKMTQYGPVPDEARLLSGHVADEKIPAIPTEVIGVDKWGGLFNNNLTAWVGLWGTSYAVNLTPDRETGFGNLNEKLFIRILRTGKFMGGERDILPPMPWQDYAKLSDTDLKAIFAYLMSLKPVKNQVPASIPALPPPH